MIAKSNGKESGRYREGLQSIFREISISGTVLVSVLASVVAIRYFCGRKIDADHYGSIVNGCCITIFTLKIIIGSGLPQLAKCKYRSGGV
jgi:hypothetical protein